MPAEAFWILILAATLFSFAAGWGVCYTQIDRAVTREQNRRAGKKLSKRVKSPEGKRMYRRYLDGKISRAEWSAYMFDTEGEY